MERGAKAVVVILAVAIVVGTLVVALHPGYREAFRAQMKSEPERSPILQSNADYYPEVSPEIPEGNDHAE